MSLSFPPHARSDKVGREELGMAMRLLIGGGLALVTLALVGFGGWVFSLPSGTVAVVEPAVPRHETEAMLAALKPTKRERPLVAVVGINDATEVTDYLVPTGILRRADVADVVMLATGEGPVQLYPAALKVDPDSTIAEFDAAYPEGADYVIVPAMSQSGDPIVLNWLQEQSRKGATIIGVCVGATVVGAAGLLNGRQATTHWYSVDDMLKRSPTISYVANRRMVADQGVVTTTGITASIPMMLTLIEAIAGREKAEAVAGDLGLESWDARHASSAFRLTRPFATTVLANRLAFWSRDKWAIELQPGMDEVSLALVADAWSRTYRSNAATFASSESAVVTANGVRVFPDLVGSQRPEERGVVTIPGQHPTQALDLTLQAIASRYGEPTANVVAMQLEYPRR
jgi:transcriptional regulator GlxA family with amidase domain